VPGETEICRARQSAVVLVRPATWLLGALVVAAVVSSAGPPVDRLGGFLVLAAVVNLLWRLLRWWDFEYVLTDKRILQVADLPLRREASLSLRKVTDISYQQSILGRLARYGTFTMESAGQNQALSRLERVADSETFNRQLSAQLFRGSRSTPVEY
jgi:uncharacterized membrane protein YdbT with pleckstrin-like domain